MYPALDRIAVLHVDDESEFAELTAIFLGREDERFDVETANSAEEALDRLRDQTFDCVVSDYDMPGRNGLELLAAIQAEYPDLPVILFTGKGSEEVASDAISAGVADYIQKETGTSQYTLLANRVRNAVEQYRSRVALEESEKRLSLFIEQSPLGVMEFNSDFDIVRVNEAGEEILGYAEAEIAGENWGVLVPESSYENVAEVIDALSEAHGGFHSINENVRGDGTHIVCEWHNRVVTDENDEVVAIFSQFQDITERKQREQDLESTRRRLEAILKNTTTPMFMKDDEGRYIFVNRTFREMFDLEDDEVVGHTDYDLFDDVVAEGVMTNDRRVLDGGNPIETEEQILVDGRERVFLSTKVPIYDTGDRSDPDEPVAVFGVAVDITDRKARERKLQRYENMVNAMQEAACIYDEAGRFVLVNDFLAEFYGKSPQELEGEPSSLIPSIRSDGDHDRYQALLDGELDEISGEAELDLRSRGPEILAYRLSPLRIGGDIEGVIGVAHVVTEYREREAELERKNEQLDSFASVISHDLRSPLTVAEGRLNLAMRECDSEHLDAAATALDRSHDLIDHLLALARDGEQVRETESIHLDELAETCWDGTVDDATLVVETGEAIEADRSRLGELLENLFRNAIEHGSAESGVTTTVTVGSMDGGFYVADDGPGVAPEERDRVFEAGYSTEPGGTGFGLAIVKKIAEAHGWTVRVTESETGGARFEITDTGVSRVDDD